MPFALARLPYALDALVPHLSEQALRLHYGKHHQGYVTKLNELVAGTVLASLPLEELIVETSKRSEAESIHNNAAQHWNHSFFWNSMCPRKTAPSPSLRREIEAQFGSLSRLRATFIEEGQRQFGSGWVWLVEKADGRLAVTKTSNAMNPLIVGDTPLVCCDVWEHAYYVDYENRRVDFLSVFFDHLLDWGGASSRMRNA